MKANVLFLQGEHFFIEKTRFVYLVSLANVNADEIHPLFSSAFLR